MRAAYQRIPKIKRNLQIKSCGTMLTVGFPQNTDTKELEHYWD